MLPSNRKAVSADAFASLLDSDATIAEFSSEQEEEAYVRADGFLIYLIKKRLVECCGPANGKVWHIVEDWWPDHTRYVYVNFKQCVSPLLTARHDLLADEFAGWCILIWVFDDIFDGATRRGSVVLYADSIVIEAELNKSLNLQ